MRGGMGWGGGQICLDSYLWRDICRFVGSLSPTERKQMDRGKRVFLFLKERISILCHYFRALWVHKYIIEQEAWSIYSVLESVLYSACC